MSCEPHIFREECFILMDSKLIWSTHKDHTSFISVTVVPCIVLKEFGYRRRKSMMRDFLTPSFLFHLTPKDQFDLSHHMKPFPSLPARLPWLSVLTPVHCYVFTAPEGPKTCLPSSSLRVPNSACRVGAQELLTES